MTELHRVRHWAEALITAHLDESWTFGFDNAKRRAGLCDYTQKRISVSRYLTARYDDDTNHQTLLHEVAHALAGPGRGPRRAMEGRRARSRLRRRHHPSRRDGERARAVDRASAPPGTSPTGIGA